MYCVVELGTYPKKKRNIVVGTNGRPLTFEKRKSAQNWVRNNKAKYLGPLQIVRFS